MEYNREDKKKKGKKTKKKGGEKTNTLQTTSLTVDTMDKNVFINEIKTGKLGFNCGTPSLKTLGGFVFNTDQKFYQQLTCFFPERKVLPLIVMASFLIYFGVALVFYYQI